jgi:hypothetical protein
MGSLSIEKMLPWIDETLNGIIAAALCSYEREEFHSLLGCGS